MEDPKPEVEKQTYEDIFIIIILSSVCFQLQK